MNLENIVKRTRTYLTIPAVVGHEGPFMQFLAEDFGLSGYNVEKKDRVVVIEKKGSSSPKILTAHLDRLGFVVNEEGDIEYASFERKRRQGDEYPSEQLATKVGQRCVGQGVFAYDPKGQALSEGKIKGFTVTAGDKRRLLFDVEELGVLPVETSIAYKSRLEEQDYLSSQIDNAISIAVARELVHEGYDGKIVLAAEEESGRSWEHICNELFSQGRVSQEMIAIDTTPYEDATLIKKGVVVLRNKDQHGVFNATFVRKVRETCEQEGISYDMKDEVIEAENARTGKKKKLGTTELGRIVEQSQGKLNGITVQVPTINYHTNNEATSKTALENYHRVLKLVAA